MQNGLNRCVADELNVLFITALLAPHWGILEEVRLKIILKKEVRRFPMPFLPNSSTRYSILCNLTYKP